MSKITSDDLSFIVQGPIYGTSSDPYEKRLTKQVLESIRRYFPKSEIILSTWNDSDTKDIDFDLLVLSNDPGSYLRDDVNKIYHNVNRQIVSTINGLNKATRKYSVKLRSDLVLENQNCLKYIGKYQNRAVDYKFLKERVLVTSVTTVNPNRIEQLPYHVCDWFYCGLTEDLINIFDIPLFPEPEYTRWYETQEKPQNNPFPTSLARYHPENYIWYSFLSKYHQISFEHISDISNKNIEISEKTFANNLVILKPSQLGIKSLKYNLPALQFYPMYTFTEWKKLYNIHCDGKLLLLIDYDLVYYTIVYRWNEYSYKFISLVYKIWTKYR